MPKLSKASHNPRLAPASNMMSPSKASLGAMTMSPKMTRTEITKEMHERMRKLAEKERHLQTLTQTKATVSSVLDNPPGSSQINFKQTQRWTLQNSISKRNIMNMTVGTRRSSSMYHQDSQAMLRDQSIEQIISPRINETVASGGRAVNEFSGMMNGPQEMRATKFLQGMNETKAFELRAEKQMANTVRTPGNTLPAIAAPSDSVMYSPRQNKQVKNLIMRKIRDASVLGMNSRTNSQIQTPQRSRLNSTTLRTTLLPEMPTSPTLKPQPQQIAALHKTLQNANFKKQHHTFDTYDQDDGSQTQQNHVNVSPDSRALLSPTATILKTATTTFQNKQIATQKHQQEPKNVKWHSQPQSSSKNRGSKRGDGLVVAARRSPTSPKMLNGIEAIVEDAEDDQMIQAIINYQQSKYSSEFKQNTKKLKRMASKEALQQPTKNSGTPVKRQSFYSEMPDVKQLRLTFKGAQSKLRQKMIQDVANNNGELEGVLSVKEVHKKAESLRAAEPDRVTQYIKNFSEIADMVDMKEDSNEQPLMHHFAQALKEKVQINSLKLILAKGLSSTVAEPTSAAPKALPARRKIDKLESLYQKMNIAEENTIKGKANAFVKKMEHFEKYKQRDIEDIIENQEEHKHDAILKYYNECQKNNCLPLPIFEKIYRKTLCLQDYVLGEGQCKGIAAACMSLDHRQVNRVCFSNCGLTGDNFATILEGLARLKDFKSIIYKQNQINSLAIQKLETLFLRRVPYQLNELQIIDCKIHSSLIEELFDLMSQKNNLRTFALTNVTHSETSWSKLCKFVEQAPKLRELNISWQTLHRQQGYTQFLEIIKDNRTLVDLSIAWNRILEEQPKPSTKLTSHNLVQMKCLASFIKYNTNLVHLDLGNTGLCEFAISFIVTFLTKSQALQCLHLDGNPGLGPELIEWIITRIRGRMKDREAVVPPLNNEFKYQQFESSPMKKGLIDLQRKRTIVDRQSSQKPANGNELWKDIRNGIKLRSIINSKRINESNKIYQGTEVQKLVIQRHLGFKEIMPMSAQWVVNSDEHTECWYCGQHILTLFLWTPRIAKLCQVVDSEVVNYYKDTIDTLLDTDPSFQPIKTDSVPHIIGPFTNWRYKVMRSVTKFCQMYDEEPPNFKEIAVTKQLIREECNLHNAVMTKNEQKAFDDLVNDYYRNNWNKTLMRFLRFQNPNIANSEVLSTLKYDDAHNEIFFTCDFLKPGRNSYVVEKRNQDQITKTEGTLMFNLIEALDGRESPIAKMMDHDRLNQDSMTQFSVHQILTNFRSDYIPYYANPRHIRSIKKDLYQSKTVFENSGEDTDMNFAAANNDLNFIDLQQMHLSEEEMAKLKKSVQMNMALIKEIYIYIQSKSKSYPWIDSYTFRNTLLKDLKLDESTLGSVSGDTIWAQVMSSQRDSMGENVPHNCLCRAGFIECLIRIARHVYLDIVDQKDLDADQTGYQKVGLNRAFNFLMDEKLKPLFQGSQFMRISFKDDLVWDLQLEWTMFFNQEATKAIFKKYSRTDLHSKTSYMSPEACFMLIIKELHLDVTKRQVKEAFSLSKKIVVGEQDLAQSANYQRLVYKEFLEFVCRVAVIMFEETEMEEIPLSKKVEHILEQMIQHCLGQELTLKKQVTVIEEFSDSDNEY